MRNTPSVDFTVITSIRRAIGKQYGQSLHRRLLVKPHHCIIQGVLVLLQPASDVIVHSASIMHQSEVSLSLAFDRFGLLEIRRFANMLIIELVLERSVCCLGEHALFFQDGENAHGLERTIEKNKTA